MKIQIESPSAPQKAEEQKLLKNPPAERTDINYSGIKAELSRYIKHYQGQYGIYYLDINTGNEFGINEEQAFTAASTSKIPLNLYLYQQIKEGKVDPDTKITYLKRDYYGGTGILQYRKYGTRYTIMYLSRISITVSDNVAANMLMRFLGKKNVKDYMRRIGGKTVDNNRNITSPKDMGLYLKQAYTFCRDNPSLGKSLMNSLLNTEFNDRLPYLLPKDIKVAHKIGNQVRVINDVGIIYADNPYIICVLSNKVDEKEATQVIANISKKIYDFVKKL